MAEHTMRVDLGGRREGLRPVIYPPNSNNPPPEPEPTTERTPREPIVTGKVHRKSTRSSSAIASATRSVWHSVLIEVIIPSAKEMLYEVITGGSQRALYRDGPRPRRGGTSYNRYAQTGVTTPANPYTQTQRTMSQAARVTHNFDEIVLETRDEADGVLEGLREIVKVYNQCSVGDMLELCNITPTFIDAQWGWTDREMVNARIIPTRNGYLLRMPPTVQITTT